MRRPLRALSAIGVALTAIAAPSVVGAEPAGAAAPDPVVIVNGTLSPEFVTEPLAARLRADGYSVRTFVLTGLGTGDPSPHRPPSSPRARPYGRPAGCTDPLHATMSR